MEKLQVPENITLRWEAWRGVGKSELAAILAATGLALAGSVVFCVLSPMESDKLIAVTVVVLAFAFASGLFTRLEGDQSIFDHFRRQARYRREQQTFRWRRREGTEVYLFAREEKR